MANTSTVQISTAMLAVLLSLVPTPRPTVTQLRRRCTYAGIRSIAGRPLKYARRHQLLHALQQWEAANG